MTDERQPGGDAGLVKLRHVADGLRARTTALGLLDELLAALIDTGELPQFWVAWLMLETEKIAGCC